MTLFVLTVYCAFLQNRLNEVIPSAAPYPKRQNRFRGIGGCETRIHGTLGTNPPRPASVSTYGGLFESFPGYPDVTRRFEGRVKVTNVLVPTREECTCLISCMCVRTSVDILSTESGRHSCCRTKWKYRMGRRTGCPPHSAFRMNALLFPFLRLFLREAKSNC